MSTAWRGDDVLLVEPWGGVTARLGRRAVVPVVALALSGLPGTAWAGFLPSLWLRVPVAVVGLLGLALWGLGVANVARSRRVLLVVRGTGSMERPRSIQEVWLRRPVEWVAGRRITVTVEPALPGLSSADPRVTLTGEGGIHRIPLYGADPEAWVAQANATLRSRNVVLVLEAPPEA